MLISVLEDEAYGMHAQQRKIKMERQEATQEPQTKAADQRPPTVLTPQPGVKSLQSVIKMQKKKKKKKDKEKERKDRIKKNRKNTTHSIHSSGSWN